MALKMINKFTNITVTLKIIAKVNSENSNKNKNKKLFNINLALYVLSEMVFK
jgi:hypothetical protein